MEIEAFYNFLLVEKGFCELTLEGYRKVLTKFFKDTKSEIPTKEIVESYIAEMRKKKYSYSHIVNTSVALERLTEFLGKKVMLGRPRKPKQIIKNVLTEGEIARLLAATKNKREQAVMSLLVYTGVRNRELCNLKVEDINFDGQFLRVLNGKGSKDRMVYFSKECSRILVEYLAEYKKEGSQFVFTALVSGKQYSGWFLRKMVKVVARRAKITKRVYPHLCRHSFACCLLNRGMPITTIQVLMGHTNLATTQIYARSTPQRIQQEYSFYQPNYV